MAGAYQLFPALDGAGSGTPFWLIPKDIFGDDLQDVLR